MPKTKISEYSTVNTDNSDIESINIAEGCAPSGINNAIRELMVHLKEFQTGASGDAFTFAGGVLISGTLNTITGAIVSSGTNSFSGTNTFTNQITVDGIAVGQGAGNVATNTAVGVNALNANTTGTDNVAVGYRALDVNTTGGSNTALGSDALGANTTASNSTAVGYYALAVSTTGAENTAIGTAALAANTTGSYNVAQGVNALRFNTTASNNTAVGYTAGYSNTTGTGNVALGYKALYATTTQSYNTALGFEAGESNTTGYSNTYVGAFAGELCTTAIQNSFFGNNSGNKITTGSKNTILGSYDGNQDGLDIRTASNYAVISDGDGNRLLSVYNGGTLALDGGATPQSGTGITFPATQSASSDANTLDDYEEGTWTPTVSGSTGNPTLTYSTRFGYYTKIGRVVTIHCALQPNTTSVAGSGDLRFTGLPFASANLTDINAVGVASTNGDFNWGTNKTQLVFNVGTNSTTIVPLAMQNGVAEATIPVGNFNNSTKYLFFSITYTAST